jgi:uncharacterized membrane protein
MPPHLALHSQEPRAGPSQTQQDPLLGEKAMFPKKRNLDPAQFLIVLGALLLTGTNASAQPFEVVDLGIDNSVRQVHVVSSGASGISDDGVVVGRADYINPPPPAFQFQLPMTTCDGCEPENLPLPQGPFSESGAATAISPDGNFIVGFAGRYFDPRRANPNSYQQGFIIHAGEVHWLEVQQLLSTGTRPWIVINAVNNRGDAVGRQSHEIAVVYRDGLASFMGTTRTNDINNSGDVAGDFSDGSNSPRRASAWEEDVRVDLPMLPGHTTSSAMGLNDLGQVVGWSGPTDGSIYPEASSAVLWEGGTVQDLVALPGAKISLAIDINDRGEIIGTSGDKPVVWQCGQIQDINSLLIGRDSSWQIVEVSDINNHGRIVGIGIKDGKQRAVMLKPVSRGAMQSGSCPGNNGQDRGQGGGRR